MRRETLTDCSTFIITTIIIITFPVQSLVDRDPLYRPSFNVACVTASPLRLHLDNDLRAVRRRRFSTSPRSPRYTLHATRNAHIPSPPLSSLRVPFGDLFT